MGKSDDFYVIHKVAEKESLSSIGRIYGYTPKQLAQYNGINPNGVLPMGATVKIQMNAQNLSQRAENELSIPVYHMAAKGDNLFKLSQQYNKVPVAVLRNWNDLKTDIVKDGQAIIIGYVNGNKPLAPVRIFANDSLLQSIAPLPVAESKPAFQGQAPLKNPNVMDAAVDGPRELLKGTMIPLTDNELILLAQAQEKIKKDAGPFQVSKPVSSQAAPLEEQRVSDDDIIYTPKLNDEGYFSAFYASAEKTTAPITKIGDAATFKSLSGLSDRKYYVLMNNILPGTIVRITASDKKSICARVLGELPEIKGAENVLLRMSNAAAAALGMQNQTQFSISLTYYQ
ncbi:MAG: LysM peptidoglycan-binding domain-containing protein [Sediminibacterium sp.]|nr:LysM peptidoglycan-binding domain-containing protein [Sediminibacterium sp.]